MAKRRRTSKPKTKTVIEARDDIRDIGRDLIADHFPGLKHAAIEYVSRTVEQEDGTVPPPKAGVIRLGKAQVCNVFEQVLHKRHFRLVINGNWWEHAPKDKREALLFHQLCHCDLVQGKPRIARHEIEGFVAELGQYGTWTSDLEAMQAALQPRLFTDMAAGANEAVEGQVAAK